jgi:hypothetical protein
MTNLPSPVAEATSGLPQPNNMADVIDSLKRLERIGAENSKTIEKVISAARELEIVIGKQYQLSRAPEIDGNEILQRIGPDAAKESGINQAQAAQTRYRLEWGQAAGPRLIDIPSETAVSANREAALRFASAIAKGLLTLLEQDLLQRQKTDEEAVAILGGAKLRIAGKATTELKNF